MTVPKSKRNISKSAYVINVGEVLDCTKRLMRKWPKSRNNTEVVPTINLAYKAFDAAMSADSIYAVLPNEHVCKMQKLYDSYGAINTLAGLCDRWVLDIPQTRTHDQAGNLIYQNVVPLKKLQNYAVVLSSALSTLSGAIKRQRKELKISIDKNPSFLLCVPNNFVIGSDAKGL